MHMIWLQYYWCYDNDGDAFEVKHQPITYCLFNPDTFLIEVPVPCGKVMSCISVSEGTYVIYCAFSSHGVVFFFSFSFFFY